MLADTRSIARLFHQLEQADVWPRLGDLQLLENLYEYMWFREADHTRLMNASGWDTQKKYVVDPLAGRISEAFADLIFGEEPDFLAAKKKDQGNLEDLVTENNLASELQAAAEISVSEGEVWWRILKDKDRSDWPLIEYHSRMNALPLFRGPHVVAVAFIHVIEEDGDAWRYVEAHANGIVVNRLYKVDQNTVTNLTQYTNTLVPAGMQVGKGFGEQVSLDSRPETEGLPPTWEHELPILAGRIINRRGRTPKVGVSQFARAKDMLYSLNEAASIGHQNMRLSARKRAVVDASILQPHTDAMGNIIGQQLTFDANEEIFIAGAMTEDMEQKEGPFKILEYEFDAEAMVTWTDHLVDTILTRCRTAPQLVGRHTESALTGPALRARLLDSTLAANGKARWYDDEVPRSQQRLMKVDELSVADGGFGRTYESTDDEPTMRRKSIIPEDPKDIVDRHAIAMGAEMESQFTAISERHPEWTTEEVRAEQDRIKQDKLDDIELAQRAVPQFAPGKVNRGENGDGGPKRTGKEGQNFNNDMDDPNKANKPTAEIG